MNLVSYQLKDNQIAFLCSQVKAYQKLIVDIDLSLIYTFVQYSKVIVDQNNEMSYDDY